MKLIVGLGNPGIEYKNTRHNIGFEFVDYFLNKNGQNKMKKNFSGLFCKLEISGQNIIFLKPQKYMNLSGEIVKKYMEFYKIKTEDILIICDDLDIGVGNYKLKECGSCGGHKGLENIENNILTQNYKRLKIGIGNNKEIDTKDYVLSKFNQEEKLKISYNYDNFCDIITEFITGNFQKAMSKYNQKNR